MFCLKYYTIYNHQNLLVKAESTKTGSRRLFTKNNQFGLDYRHTSEAQNETGKYVVFVSVGSGVGIRSE